jgi:hypothetical protein
MALFSSKVGMYCGAVVEISQPLLPMGTNTPIFITNLSSLRRRCSGVFAKAVPVLKMAVLLMC